MAMELRIEGLKKAFGDKQVLKGASFTFQRGRMYGLLGRNGAGKTTLMNCLSGELSADDGTAQLTGPDGSLQPLREEDVGYVLSTPVVPEFLTAREFLQFFLEINRGKIPYPKAPDVYLDYMCIDPADRGKLLKDFSHGMKNKMQMLATIIASPDIILLDEPLTSLDVVAAHEMKEMLMDMKKDHIIIFSTHILQLAKDLCDEIVLLHGGNLSGVPEEIYHSVDFEEKLMQMLSDESETKVDDIESFNKTYIGGEVDENACVGVNTQPDVQASDRDYDPYDYD